MREEPDPDREARRRGSRREARRDPLRRDEEERVGDADLEEPARARREAPLAGSARRSLPPRRERAGRACSRQASAHAEAGKAERRQVPQADLDDEPRRAPDRAEEDVEGEPPPGERDVNAGPPPRGRASRPRRSAGEPSRGRRRRGSGRRRRRRARSGARRPSRLPHRRARRVLRIGNVPTTPTGSRGMSHWLPEKGERPDDGEVAERERDRGVQRDGIAALEERRPAEEDGAATIDWPQTLATAETSREPLLDDHGREGRDDRADEDEQASQRERPAREAPARASAGDWITATPPTPQSVATAVRAVSGSPARRKCPSTATQMRRSRRAAPSGPSRSTARP